jgi:hypothetical protein
MGVMSNVHYVGGRTTNKAHVKQIKLRASFPEPERYGLMKVTEVVFKLGEGPCGRHVETLAYSVTDQLLTITQTSYATPRPYPPYAGQEAAEFAESQRPRWFGLVGCKSAFEYNQGISKAIRKAIMAWRDDCEIKEFVYKLSDVHGRIEVLK